MPTDTEPLEWHDPQTRVERRHAHEVGDDRRPMSVGRVWVIGVLCLLLGALLNAPGIRKTALSQPVGWKRDVATFFADPLYDVSHALFLDRLRLGVQDLAGRKGEDKIDLTLPSPTRPQPTTSSVPGDKKPPPAPPKKAFSPQHQARLWVGGDSLSELPGQYIITQALATQAIGQLRPVDTHVSTGLARPEGFNWPSYLGQVLLKFDPDIMVLTIGSNDDQTLTGAGGGEKLGTPEWQDEYRRRVGGLMDEVTKGKVTLFWIGIPQMRNVPRYETRYKMINQIVREEAEKRAGKVYYLDTAALLAGPDGGYSDYVTRIDGSVVKVRSADGIHFERAGADRIANAVLAAFNEVFDLTSWKTGGSTTTTTKPRTTTTTKPKRR
jgi:hypothetical protein